MLFNIAHALPGLAQYSLLISVAYTLKALKLYSVFTVFYFSGALGVGIGYHLFGLGSLGRAVY